MNPAERVAVVGTGYCVPPLIRTAEGVSFSPPYYHITDAGLANFQAFGEKSPPEAVQRLLRRNGLESSRICLITHQASRVLLDAWRSAIQPDQYLETLEQFANMVGANVPVNLAYHLEHLEKNDLVLLAVGPEFMTSALLLRRGS